jgi:murein DD-endopeptidase MepM/ murein hydrolase activator NlpD
MSSVVAYLRSWPMPRAFAVAVIAIGAAACSSESARFNDNPYASRSGSAEVTNSIKTAPVSRVQTSQLPPPSASRPATVASNSGTSGGGRGMASYQPGQGPDPVVTGSTAQQPTYSPPPNANHALPPPIQSAPPRQSAPVRATPPAAKQPVSTTQPSIHTVAPGETLIKISRMYNKPLTEIARVNNIPPHTKVNIGDKIIIPGSRSSAAPKKDAPKVAQSKPLSPSSKAQTTAKAAPKAGPKSNTSVAQNETTESVGVAQSAEPPPAANPVRAASNGSPSFRWPAKGRVIAGFGPRTNGQQNDGINLALPEGTPIKASEDGVVAYSGNELKGYGNLVLVRHSNGYVTAYAHARELLVKRGDQIKRGQVIGRSGQTGNVDAPQLHFEIRKGPTPLDPMPLLTGG